MRLIIGVISINLRELEEWDALAAQWAQKCKSAVVKCI